MNPVSLLSGALSLAAAGALLVAVRQHERLTALRSSGAAPQAASATPAEAAPAPGGAQAADATPNSALNDEERREFMRLRGQYQPLLARVTELAALSNRNEVLKARLQAAQQPAQAFPADYIRRSQARNLGNQSPEGAFETLLWALQNRDTNALLQLVGGHIRDQFAQMLATDGPEKLFRDAGAMPGGRIVAAQPKGPDAVELLVEFLPGHTEPLVFRRVGGSWVMGE